MRILYFKGYKWFLSQNQRVRIDFLIYRRYEVLAKHIKPFFKKHWSERMSVSGLKSIARKYIVCWTESQLVCCTLWKKKLQSLRRTLWCYKEYLHFEKGINNWNFMNSIKCQKLLFYAPSSIFMIFVNFMPALRVLEGKVNYHSSNG